MSQFLAFLLPVGLFVAFIFIPIFMIERWRAWREKARRSPLKDQLLRGPGESLLQELDGVRVEMVLWMTSTPSFALLFLGVHLSTSYLAGVPETRFRIALTSIMVLASLSLYVYKLFSLERRRTRLRLGYEGEVAVAQELNQLMRQGVALFHDVPGEGFNIDHVLVGTRGVYAIETKARTKSNRDKGSAGAKVISDGKGLSFPGWKETRPLEQAASQAKWLARWLGSAVGERIEVRPGLALPGWFVERTGHAGVHVFNPKNGGFLVKGWLKEPLSVELVKRIEHQLEQRCRNVETAIYGKKNAA